MLSQSKVVNGILKMYSMHFSFSSQELHHWNYNKLLLSYNYFSFWTSVQLVENVSGEDIVESISYLYVYYYYLRVLFHFILNKIFTYTFVHYWDNHTEFLTGTLLHFFFNVQRRDKDSTMEVGRVAYFFWFLIALCDPFIIIHFK